MIQDSLYSNLSMEEPESPWYVRAGKGLIRAPIAMVDDLVSLGEDVASWATGAEQEWFDMPNFFDGEDLGTAGAISEELGSFALGMIGSIGIVSKLGKAGKLGRLGKYASLALSGEKGVAARIGAEAVIGAGVDFALADTEDGNLSNLLDRFPILHDSVLTYLKHEEDDSALEKRLKNAMEGIPLGIAGDYLFEGMKRILRFKRADIDRLADGDTLKQAELIAKETGVPFNPNQSELNVDALLKRAEDAVSSPPRETLADQVGRLSFTKNRWGETLPVIESGMGRNPEQLKELIGYVARRGAEAEDKVFKGLADSGMSGDDAKGFIDDLVNGLARQSGSAPEFQGSTRVPKLTNDDYAGLTNQITGLKLDDLKETALKDVKSLDEVRSRLGVYMRATKAYAEELDRLLTKANGHAELWQDDRFYAEMVSAIQSTADFLGSWMNIRRATGQMLQLQTAKARGKLRPLHLINDEMLGDLEKAQLDKMVRRLGEAGKNPKELKKIAEVIRKVAKSDKPNLKAAAHILNGPSGNHFIQILSEYRKINMLSGLSTQGINILGNMAYGVIHNALEGAGALVIGAVRGGKDRMTTAMFKAQLSGMWDGTGHFFRSLRNELNRVKDEKGWWGMLTNISNAVNRISVDPEVIADEHLVSAISRDYFSQTPLLGGLVNHLPLAGRAVDAYGKVGRAMAYGSMQVTDAWAKDAYFTAQLKFDIEQFLHLHRVKPDQAAIFRREVEDAVRQFNRGLPVKPFADAGMNKLIEQFEGNAVRAAQYGTYQGALKKESLGERFYQWSLQNDRVTPQLIRCFVTPFVRTPLNILSFVSDRTPVLRKLSSDYQHIIKYGTQAEKDMLQARLFSGGLMYAGAAVAYWNGMLTGSHDKSDRASLLAAGIPEYAIKLGDKFYSYNRLDPLGYFLGLTADILQAGDRATDGEFNEAISSLMVAASQNLLSKSYMQGLGDLFEMANDPGRYADAYIRSQLSTLIPLSGAQRTINQVVSPELKEVETLLDELKNASIYKGELPDRLDMLGQPISRETDVWSMLLGIQTTTPKQSPGIKELAKYRIFPQDRVGTVGGVKLSREQHSRYKAILGDLKLSKQLDELVQSQFYRQAPEAQQQKILKSYLNRYRSIARSLLLQQDRTLQADVRRRAERYLELLRTTPDGKQALLEDWRTLRDFNPPDPNDVL